MQIKLIAVDPALRETHRWPIAIEELEEHFLCILRYADGTMGSAVYVAPKSHYTKEGDDLI